MKKEIEFKSDFEMDPTVHKVEEVDPKKDLGVEVIEELPELEVEEQLEVKLKKKREAVRERLAIVFVVGLFMVIIIGMIFGYLGNEQNVQNISDLLIALSGILSGPLGFIIGYYFRKQEEEKER